MDASYRVSVPRLDAGSRWTVARLEAGVLRLHRVAGSGVRSPLGAAVGATTGSEVAEHNAHARVDVSGRLCLTRQWAVNLAERDAVLARELLAVLEDPSTRLWLIAAWRLHRILSEQGWAPLAPSGRVRMTLGGSSTGEPVRSEPPNVVRGSHRRRRLGHIVGPNAPALINLPLLVFCTLPAADRTLR